MAKYPIKMLKDENGTPFVPLVSTEAVRTPEGETAEEELRKKLEVSNIVAGKDILLSVDGNNITINNTSSKYSIKDMRSEEAKAILKDWRQEILDTGVIPPITLHVTDSYMLYLTDAFIRGNSVNAAVLRFKGRGDNGEYNGYRVYYETIIFDTITGEVSSYKNGYSTDEYEVIAYGGMSPNPKKALTTDNTNSYTPTSDYNPATKKYVDDSIRDSGYATTDYVQEATSDIALGLNEEIQKKQDILVSGTNIKTINNISILGDGNIETFSGSYNDLTDKPEIPTDIPTNLVNGTTTGSIRTINAIDSIADPLGENAVAVGNQTKATGSYSNAEGTKTVASGYASHAEGSLSNASKDAAHAEGYKTYATAIYSHSEGNETRAEEIGAHAEGYKTTASGIYSHAEGYGSSVNGHYSHVEGYYTSAGGQYQHVQGKYNIKDTENKYAHIVGNGASSGERSNAHTIDWSGNAWFAGTVKGSTPTEDNDLATKKYVDDTVAASAGSGSSFDPTKYLAIDNTTEYTPISNYHPATKKYVDDNKVSSNEITAILDEYGTKQNLKVGDDLTGKTISYAFPDNIEDNIAEGEQIIISTSTEYGDHHVILVSSNTLKYRYIDSWGSPHTQNLCTISNGATGDISYNFSFTIQDIDTSNYLYPYLFFKEDPLLSRIETLEENTSKETSKVTIDLEINGTNTWVIGTDNIEINYINKDGRFVSEKWYPTDITISGEDKIINIAKGTIFTITSTYNMTSYREYGKCTNIQPLYKNTSSTEISCFTYKNGTVRFWDGEVS